MAQKKVCKEATFVHVFTKLSYGPHTGCPKINFTFLNVINVRTNIRIATSAMYIDRGDL